MWLLLFVLQTPNDAPLHHAVVFWAFELNSRVEVSEWKQPPEKKTTHVTQQKAFCLWYGGWCLQTLQPPLPQRLREDLLVFRVMLLKGYIGAGCLPQLGPDTHTKSVVPLYGLCEGREPKQLCPFLQWKRPANVKSKRSCPKACDLFMAFRFTLSDAGSCEAEH